MRTAFTTENVGRGLDYIAMLDSTGDYFDYSKVQTRVYYEFQRADGAAGPAPYVRHSIPTSRPIGPTDQAATLPFSTGLSHKLQVIDRWARNTDWGGGMLAYNPKHGGYDGTRQGTYPTLWFQDRPPLELPRYNYAAMDSQALYDEAQQRVAAFQAALFGPPRPIGGQP